jgi:hypothetical protein
MKKTFLAILAAGLLISCGPSRQQSPILVQRGIKADERNYHVVQEGYGIDAKLKRVFLAGYIAEGMNKDLVNLLWGPPDKEYDNGLTWEYIDYTTGEIIARLKWEEIDPLKHRGVDWTNASKLIEIEGDPDGGSPPRPDFEDEGY